MVTADELIRAAHAVRGRGRPQCLRVASCATPLAASPFESVLRSLLLGFPVFDVEPQGRVDTHWLVLRPNLDCERFAAVESGHVGGHR